MIPSARVVPDLRGRALGQGWRLSIEPDAACGKVWIVTSGSDDARLISESLADPPVFAEIFDRHAKPLFDYLARRAGQSDAEDLLGELFRIAFEIRDRYDPTRTDARPWLYGIAANLVLKRNRSIGRRDLALRRLAVLGGEAVPAHFEDVIVDQADNIERFQAAANLLKNLAPADREVVLLFAWEQLSYQQIAEALDIPVGTVRSRLNRVRTKLRELPSERRKELEDHQHRKDNADERPTR